MRACVLLCLHESHLNFLAYPEIFEIPSHTPIGSGAYNKQILSLNICRFDFLHQL
jgi:hypothetical protein